MSPTIHGGTAFFLSVLFCFLLGRLAPSFGLMDRPDGGRKCHEKPTPLVGGPALLLAIWATHMLFPFKPEWSNLLIGSTLFFVVGFLDDLIQLKPFGKLILQTIAASILILLESPGADVWIQGAFVFWVLLFTNAVNYTDNSNGTCSGMVLILLCGFLVSGLSPNHFPWILALMGGTLGFIGFNFPSARIFLGDSGTHFLGSALALMLWKLAIGNTQGSVPLISIACLSFLPLFDLVQVSLRRWWQGLSIWEGDHRHLAHLLALRLGSPVRGTVAFWFLAGLSVLIAFLSAQSN
jgi:UDP-GlcNAc:undecaprenyl-phosphate/decaprenyl-phosphate GlcNAc-1-phosphate transferase